MKSLSSKYNDQKRNKEIISINDVPRPGLPVVSYAARFRRNCLEWVCSVILPVAQNQGDAVEHFTLSQVTLQVCQEKAIELTLPNNDFMPNWSCSIESKTRLRLRHLQSIIPHKSEQYIKFNKLIVLLSEELNKSIVVLETLLTFWWKLASFTNSLLYISLSRLKLLRHSEW